MTTAINENDVEKYPWFRDRSGDFHRDAEGNRILVPQAQNFFRTDTPEHWHLTVEQYTLKGMTRDEALAAYDRNFQSLNESQMEDYRRADLNAHLQRGGKPPNLEPRVEWLVDADDFIARELPERTPYVRDKATGATFLYQASLNELWAYRGQGKSVVANALINLLVDGGEWLNFSCEGSKKVLLVDGELPQAQLQERLKEFVGKAAGQLKILSPELSEFPNLSVPAEQEKFLDQIRHFDPEVLVFDTLTRCFRFDTNDPVAWLAVNDFLIRLRTAGYCVLLIHHAGKNGTQRGRTDGDDNLDVSVKLDRPYGWQAGDGLAFTWTWEKVRHGGHLPDFQAAYQDGRWTLTEDERLPEVIKMLQNGDSQRKIATALDLNQSSVSRMLKKIRARGLDRLNSR
jgi:hypothetical protein